MRLVPALLQSLCLPTTAQTIGGHGGYKYA